jgi:hypothetical protein
MGRGESTREEAFMEHMEQWRRRGVVLPAPHTVDIGPEVDPDRIAPGVVVHAGCRLRGAALSIGPGCVLGEEAPMTVDDCQLERDVRLAGGFARRSTFLTGARLGSAAHVRPGTLMEEGAGGGHAVGFKQTIFMPFVTAGSLINFCDALMAGGTGLKDHGEIGSSYIHFNFTPHGDKATASLVGDVPRGVMLDQPRIFLGGQGGLVGPARIAFGALVPAGVVQRRDVPAAGLAAADTGRGLTRARPFTPGAHGNIERKAALNFAFLGNLAALAHWYREARAVTMDGDAFSRWAWEGARRRLDEAHAERLGRLRGWAESMEGSLARVPPAQRAQPPYAAQARLWAMAPSLAEQLDPDTLGRGAADAEREAFLAAWTKTARPGEHVASVRALDSEARRAGTAWLDAIVTRAEQVWTAAAGA